MRVVFGWSDFEGKKIVKLGVFSTDPPKYNISKFERKYKGK